MADIITLTEFRDYDDLPSPAEHENQITSAIGLATSYIEEKTGRVFELAEEPSPSPSPSSNDVVEILDGKNSTRLYTRNAPIVAIIKIEYWCGNAWVEYDIITTPYSFKADSNIIYFIEGHRFVPGYQNIRVTFEYGYDAALPNDLKLACYLITKHIVMEAERLGITNQSDGEQTFNYTHAIPKQALEIIRRYKTTW